MVDKSVNLKKRQRIGKYRVERRLALGPHATVYQAMDTIEGIRVALKIPNDEGSDKQHLDDFKREVRLAARLYHPNILPLKDASFVDGRFLIVTPLGTETLARRLTRRLSRSVMVSYAEQLLDALAYAHSEGVLHCDVKPENIILFDDNHLMLADFGIAKRALRTVKASGSGTLGYLAPEQAMGRPSPRSDVFAAGLLIYRMFAGVLPEWPYRWPLAGFARLRSRVKPAMMDFLRRTLDPEPGKRYRDAQRLFAAFMEIRRRGILLNTKRKTRAEGAGKDWREVRYRQFQRRFGRQLESHHHCGHCHGPMSESMRACPWCGQTPKKYRGETRFPAHCPSCQRGVKLDWAYCAWCYGAGFEVETNRRYPDRRYSERCSNCREPMMPFMRYCPWCRTKARQRWGIKNSAERCHSCGWGVTTEFWTHCPWCTAAL